jgi:hypothetical protein
LSNKRTQLVLVCFLWLLYLEFRVSASDCSDFFSLLSPISEVRVRPDTVSTDAWRRLTNTMYTERTSQNSFLKQSLYQL